MSDYFLVHLKKKHDLFELSKKIRFLCILLMLCLFTINIVALPKFNHGWAYVSLGRNHGP
jgi:hypothetical protein